MHDVDGFRIMSEGADITGKTTILVTDDYGVSYLSLLTRWELVRIGLWFLRQARSRRER